VKRRLLRTAIIVFWLAMLAWLIRFEAFPEYFTHSLDGYRSLLSRDIIIMDSWMKIMSRGIPVGYTHTSMDTSESTPLEHCTIDNRTDLKVMFMGMQRIATLTASFTLDVNYNLQKFSCTLLLGADSYKITGERIRGKVFKVSTNIGGTPATLDVELPDDVVLFSPMSAVAMKRMRVGQEIKLHTLDPFTMKKTDIMVRALRKERLTISGKRCDTIVLGSQYHENRMLTWMDSAGNVVRQETPLGWTFEKCTSEEAFDAFKNSEGGDDIFASVAGLLMR
jgi:hypothetical protein